MDGRGIAVQASNDPRLPVVFLYQRIDGLGRQPWFVGIHYPLEAYNVTLRRIATSVFAGVAILAVAVVLAVVIGHMISDPVRRLARASEQIGRLDFSASGTLPPSSFREIDVAATAHNAMLAGLRWFETYVPKSLVPILLRQGQTALDPRSVEVTVLFTDIVGFSRIGERLEASHLADFLNRQFALLGAAIHAQGGSIDKYVGDSVMAFWGAPDVQPDHAARAYRAAQEITAALGADNERRRAKARPPVRVRIGIHSGTAVAGNIGAPGRVNYTLIGDTVNVAQRLEQFGKTVDDGRADVVVTASLDTVELLPADIPRVAIGSHQLPGRSQPTEIFRLFSPTF